jgi:RNA polymerase sigma-70 factor (ECF subfamily)
MTERAAEIFEEHRLFLTKLASRITANWSDAEEMVAQALLRWNTVSTERIENPRAFLATVVTRLALNHKSSARSRSEIVVEPENIAGLEGAAEDNVGGLADALTDAFEIVLSRLSPLERAVFLLREAFQMEYAEISDLLDEKEANCRQILRRSRDKLQSPEPRFRTNDAECELALERFLEASRCGKVEDFMDLVAPGVVLLRDPGDIGLPCPAPLHGLRAAMDHVVSYFRRKLPASWSCFRVGEKYELASLRDKNQKLLSALISTLDENRQLIQIDHITCPTRLSMLLKLVGNRP